MTCFNRRETTIAALEALNAAVAGQCRYQVVLVDDGSTDGTTDDIGAAYPDVLIINGTGNLYWNGGMRLAWQSALPLKSDFFLWLNDDTILRPKAIADLLALYGQARKPKTIVVGCTTDPTTSLITYGGYRRASRLSRLRFRRLTSDETQCDTMNGNCVLFPAQVVTDVGINSERYSHAFGDHDYALRARRAGYMILELKVPVGEQEHNHRYLNSIGHLNLDNFGFIFAHPKGIPIREWYYFCREFGGPLWPVNFLLRYVKIARI
jgi:GT2 family glycosyltransferase